LLTHITPDNLVSVSTTELLLSGIPEGGLLNMKADVIINRLKNIYNVEL